MGENEELLDIEQAARFLHVSETSLRRWTNAGRLACLRVGRRRERRFRRTDLLAFMENQPAGDGSPPPLHTPLEKKYVSVGGVPVPHGAHLCGLYSTDVGRIRQAVEFLLDGMRPGSVCLVAAPEEARQSILLYIKESRPSLRADVAAGRLILSGYEDSADDQLAYWKDQLQAAVSAGAHSCRVVGDLRGFSSHRKVQLEDLLEYEARYEAVIASHFPVITLCQYDVHAFPSLALLNALKLHKDTFSYPAERLLA